ncbi:hypothetical protein B0I37DRAFT_375775 [Chaetomium sp. MPI-CAGE-AT-0009]|nr:hypothetical protein B0I37DRAFT_375775 [Chaetomium sp. MPI-CAGE-AT-0009]
MGLYSAPPPARPFSEDKATLLIAWWITAMCAVVIILRLVGRYIRVERLFNEDWFAAAALIPLLLRMAFVHPTLLYGTNNVLVDSTHPLPETEIHQRSIGSRLVIVSRIIHPTILWLFKAANVAFFHHLIGPSGKQSYTLLLRLTRYFLLATFLAVIITALAECHPYPQPWQVIPDPGGQCRQAYAYLVTTTACSALTDLLLVAIPVPVVFQSRVSAGHKALLLLLFSLPLLTVVVALYKVPEILREQGYQATRTMWASVEVLVATFAANTLSIGTFVRDTGLKKRRFRFRPAEGDGVRSVKRGSGVAGQKVAWGGLGLEAGGGIEASAKRYTGDSEQMGGTGQTSLGVMDHKEGGGSTESLDSLIPRGRFDTSRSALDAMRVIKTTSIRITASEASKDDSRGGSVEHLDSLVLRPGGGAVTASARGGHRGSSIQLQDLGRLPDSDHGCRSAGAPMTNGAT